MLKILVKEKWRTELKIVAAVLPKLLLNFQTVNGKRLKSKAEIFH